MTLIKVNEVLKGGSGSGDFGHKGRPGKRGGSARSGGGKGGKPQKGDYVKWGINVGPITKIYQSSSGIDVIDFTNQHGGKNNGVELADVNISNIEEFKRRGGKVKNSKPTPKPISKKVDIKPEKSGSSNLGNAVMTPGPKRPRDPKVKILDKRFISPSNNSVGSADPKIISNISARSGVSRKTVKEYISAWNGSDEILKTVISEAVRQELGVKLSSYEESTRTEDLKDARRFNILDDNMFSDYKKITRTIYNETQNRLRDADITEVTLHRGMKVRNKNNKSSSEARAGDTTKYTGNSVESWTTSPEIAEGFMGLSSTRVGSTSLSLTAKFPIDRVFSMPVTGVGTSIEREFIMLGNGPNDTVFIGRTVS